MKRNRKINMRRGNKKREEDYIEGKGEGVYAVR